MRLDVFGLLKGRFNVIDRVKRLLSNEERETIAELKELTEAYVLLGNMNPFSVKQVRAAIKLVSIAEKKHDEKLFKLSRSMINSLAFRRGATDSNDPAKLIKIEEQKIVAFTQNVKAHTARANQALNAAIQASNTGAAWSHVKEAEGILHVLIVAIQKLITLERKLKLIDDAIRHAPNLK